jgi:hypothetical protein
VAASSLRFRYDTQSDTQPIGLLCESDNLVATQQKDRQCTYKCNIEARSLNLCCCGRAISITYFCLWVCVCARACSLTNPARNVPPFCHLLPLWLHHILWHYLINNTILRKKDVGIKYVFLHSLQLLFVTYLIPRIIQRVIVINVETSVCEVPVIIFRF